MEKELLINTLHESQEDHINPKHYKREGGMESIEEMEVVFGTVAVMNFCLLNVWKYRYRAADKNGQEDLAKSDWYMNKYKELRTKITAEPPVSILSNGFTNTIPVNTLNN